MKTSATDFATLLHDSSLDSEQRQYVIDMLPVLSAKQIETVAKILKKDTKKKKQIKRKAQLQEDKVLHDMETQLLKDLKALEKEGGEFNADNAKN